MSKASVQKKIAHAFMELVPKTPTKRVTVTELARYLEIDRKTFYNYFENIDNLMIWIFRDYVATMLEDEKFTSWEKITPSSGTFDPYPSLPFYARQKKNGMLCQELFFKTMAYHWENHRHYYTTVFSSGCYIDLFDYIIELYFPPFREDVEFFLNLRDMPKDAINFLAEYHVMGVFGRLRYHFTQTHKYIMQEEIDPFWNYAHILMRESVDCCYEKVERQGLANLFKLNKVSSRYRGFTCHTYL